VQKLRAAWPLQRTSHQRKWALIFHPGAFFVDRNNNVTNQTLTNQQFIETLTTQCARSCNQKREGCLAVMELCSVPADQFAPRYSFVWLPVSSTRGHRHSPFPTPLQSRNFSHRGSCRSPLCLLEASRQRPTIRRWRLPSKPLKKRSSRMISPCWIPFCYNIPRFTDVR